MHVIAFAYVRLRRVLVMVGLSSVAALSISSASTSAFTEPGLTGTWGDFANCPAKVIVLLGRSACEHSYATGGMVQIGHSTVPISVPGDTFDVGITTPGGPGVVMSPPHGILNGPAQPVPGGLLGTIGNVQLTGVTARLEWAASTPPSTVFGFTEPCGSNPLVTFDICKILKAKAGTAVTLRAKIHLLSPFLGSSCFIGSAAHPIVIALTTGVTSPPPPAKPIHGSSLEFLTFISPFYQQAVGFTFVNNSFSVPAATGCGTTTGGVVDASINHKLGLPSPAGKNMIAISAIAEQAPAENVLEHGWTGE
ncbi:MAG TPA: hypothetical protein VFY36_03110 [Solirubrobacteraceae bacterium]|nr:hypothetical protein [Solirubrobacteraceae bacterium]